MKSVTGGLGMTKYDAAGHVYGVIYFIRQSVVGIEPPYVIGPPCTM